MVGKITLWTWFYVTFRKQIEAFSAGINASPWDAFRNSFALLSVKHIVHDLDESPIFFGTPRAMVVFFCLSCIVFRDQPLSTLY